MSERLVDHSEAELEPLFVAIGRAMSNWAQVERWMGMWFAVVTGMTQAEAKAVFFSAKSFSGRTEMFDAALLYSKLPHTTALLTEISKKAATYSSFRNTTAHGIPEILTDAAGRRPVLGEGTNDPNSKTPARRIEILDLQIAATNFVQLYLTAS